MTQGASRRGVTRKRPWIEIIEENDASGQVFLFLLVQYVGKSRSSCQR